MRRKFGLGLWAKKALGIIGPGRDYVIDSIRNPGEIDCFAASGNFTLFEIVAPLEYVFLRISYRPERTEKEPATLIAFKASEGCGLA